VESCALQPVLLTPGSRKFKYVLVIAIEAQHKTAVHLNPMVVKDADPSGMCQNSPMINSNNEKSDLPASQFRESPKFDAPADYRIRVQGHVDDSWSDRLGGMTITRAYTANKEPMTILIGGLLDQAALSGVLNAIYNQHLSVISVELLNEN
jgi:hypothetical protein